MTVRKQNVADSAGATGFDLAWLPGAVHPAPAVAGALPPVAAALHSGGWLVPGHSKSGGTPVQDALTRPKTVAHGGTPTDEAAACHPLHQTGLTSVRTMPTPSGALAIATGQKPASRTPRPG